jgi:phosphatidylserine decarboxylase
MIKFGSRTEVYVPVDRMGEIAVKVGDRVKGGKTALASLKLHVPAAGARVG